jgi:class 3 adenylate cyclase
VPREFYYRWEWHFQASPEQLWPLVTDTNRFDRNVGLPAYALVEEPVAGNNQPANSRRRLRIRMYGVPLDWVEEPFEWIRPHRFGVIRYYEPGPLPFLQPLGQVRMLAELTPLPEGGTHMVYEIWARPRNMLGYLAIPYQIGFIFARRFAASFREYDRLATEHKSLVDLPGRSVSFAPGGRERLMALQELIVSQGVRPELVARLLETIEQADDLTLNKLRPYALADYWAVARREVLEMSLVATRVGLLDFQWDLLCPLCRVAKDSVSNLGQVDCQVHCDTCNIDYQANFDRSVELTFRPNPAIRLIDDYIEFCTSGPQATPHIMAQQLLPPGADRTVPLQLEQGRYRLRALALPGGQFMQVTAGGPPEVAVNATAAGWSNDELPLGPSTTLQLKNRTAQEQLFILERMAWTDQAVTAAEVTALQRFRDLFAEEALRPGEQISVGSLTILFTDLRDSTRLYREIGDAPAFGLVMDHFDILQQAITAEDGAIVKTIGDAVMAVFRRPMSGLQAIFVAQQRLAMVPPGKRPLHLRAALHYGPCIAVSLNNRLDYFGSTVNIASRLEKLALGGDVVISETVYADPEVAAFLAQQENKYLAELFKETLRGFDEERFTLWRVKMLPEPNIG